jgi:hypothetical protein
MASPPLSVRPGMCTSRGFLVHVGCNEGGGVDSGPSLRFQCRGIGTSLEDGLANNVAPSVVLRNAVVGGTRKPEMRYASVDLPGGSRSYRMCSPFLNPIVHNHQRKGRRCRGFGVTPHLSISICRLRMLQKTPRRLAARSRHKWLSNST